MGRVRKPFQGVWNIVRFNWHFYAGAASIVAGVFLTALFLPPPAADYLRLLCIVAVVPVAVSLAVSFYVYDLAGLYDLGWLELKEDGGVRRIANIHAGFDETSHLLKEKFPRADLTVLDFYDPLKHTEVSIERARKVHPPFPGTRSIETSRLPLDDASTDLILLFLAAHEIRNDAERVRFFREVSRALKPDGEAVVTEHLRDLPNFIAYNVGFFHFIPRRSWKRSFAESGLAVFREMKPAPFITSFFLRKHGSAD